MAIQWTLDEDEEFSGLCGEKLEKRVFAMINEIAFIMFTIIQQMWNVYADKFENVRLIGDSVDAECSLDVSGTWRLLNQPLRCARSRRKCLLWWAMWTRIRKIHEI